MKRHIYRMIACLLLATALFGAVPTSASAAFEDVPAGSWAEASITRCVQSGLFQGETATRFGMGKPMTRAAFTVVLCRFFGWELIAPEHSTYTDVQDPARWYYSAVETAFAHGAITLQTENFRPNDAITREEMAVMLVRALGYTALAGKAQEMEIPFTDVTTNKGYIAMAYEMGIINGTSATTFSPERTATREQAAVMLMRLYDKYNCPAASLTGMVSDQEGSNLSGYDTVVISGGRLSYTNRVLMTRPGETRETALVEAIHGNHSKALLQVVCNASALKGKTREMATTLVSALQESSYDGLYLTFPDLDASRTSAMSALVKATNELLASDKLLYVEVKAPSRNSENSRIYPYSELAAVADRLVLQIAPYQIWDGKLMSAPVEPLEEVYYALAELNDSVPADKLCLQLTTATTIWQDNRISGTVNADDLQKLLSNESTQLYYSEYYKCAYLQQTGVTPARVAWYLNEQAVRERVQLCGLFGVTNVYLGDHSMVSPEIFAGLKK